MVRKNILPRHSRRVALHDDMVFVLPTTLVRYQFRNAHAKDISCEVFVSGANLHSHVVAHLQSWLQGGLSLLLPRGSLRGESETPRDVVRHSATLPNVYVLFVFRCCKSDLRFRVGSFQRRALWPCVQPCGWLRGRKFGLFRFFLWFSAVCPLSMRACATTRTLRSSHNC